MSTTRKQEHFRDSVDGQFVKKDYAQRNPATTERELIRHPAPKPAPEPKKK